MLLTGLPKLQILTISVHRLPYPLVFLPGPRIFFRISTNKSEILLLPLIDIQNEKGFVKSFSPDNGTCSTHIYITEGNPSKLKDLV